METKRQGEKDMKKKVVVLLCAMIFAVSGCASQKVEKVSMSKDNVEMTSQMVETEVATDITLSEQAEGVINMQATEQIESTTIQETEQHTPKAGEVMGEEMSEPEREYITVQNPSEEYYIAEEIVSDTQPYTLTILEKKQNQIIDDEQWFEKNGVAKQFGDEAYSSEFWPYGSTYLVLHGPDKNIEMDFSEFQYSSEYKQEDYDFIAQSITHTYVENNILYVETGHWTYAESAPKNAYITAIDLEDYHVIWKSQPLVCNSRDFTIVGDVIFCGYGFTDEEDYLYQLDKKTGVVLAKEPLKSAPDHIIYQNDKLYVRTYNTDYVFEVK